MAGSRSRTSTLDTPRGIAWVALGGERGFAHVRSPPCMIGATLCSTQYTGIIQARRQAKPQCPGPLLRTCVPQMPATSCVCGVRTGGSRSRPGMVGVTPRGAACIAVDCDEGHV
jgi:hypothetical protein